MVMQRLMLSLTPSFVIIPNAVGEFAIYSVEVVSCQDWHPAYNHGSFV